MPAYSCRLCDAPIPDSQHLNGFGRCVWCAYDDDRLQALEIASEAHQ